MIVICSTISTAAATTSPTTTVPAIVNPVANDDFATTNQGTSVVLLLLDNDVVPEGATGSFTEPANGILGADGADLTYTSSPDLCGQDTFAYTLSAGDLSDSATVTVDVVCGSGATSTTGPTDGGSTPPAIVELSVEDDFAVGNMNEALSIPVLDNDTLPANAGGAFGKPEHGTVVEPTENGLVYMPNEGKHPLVCSDVLLRLLRCSHFLALPDTPQNGVVLTPSITRSPAATCRTPRT